MNATNRRRRAGMSVVEVLVAAVLLVVASVSLLTLSSTEVKGVAFSEDRLHAALLLEELRQCYGFLNHARTNDLGPPPAPGAAAAPLLVTRALVRVARMIAHRSLRVATE